MVNMLPPDIDAIVYERHPRNLYRPRLPALSQDSFGTRQSQRDSSLQRRSSRQIREPLSHYRALIISSKRWDAVGHQGSAFEGQGQQLQRSHTPQGQRPRFTMPSWYRTAPIEQEPHERTFEGKLCKWCGACQPWFFGDRAHLTSEHVSGHSVSSRRNAPWAPPIPPSGTTSPSVNAVLPVSAPAIPLPSAATRSYFNAGIM